MNDGRGDDPGFALRVTAWSQARKKGAAACDRPLGIPWLGDKDSNLDSRSQRVPESLMI